MVNETAVNPAVTVLKRVDIDKPEGQFGGGDYGVQRLRRAVIEGDQTAEQ